jgi:geranylgeranyl diphosphate synthase type II
VSAVPFLEQTRALVNDALDRWLPSPAEPPQRLHEAMRYSVFAGGKRLRPALARAACHAAGGSDADVLPTACALEMLHTYSLIHDDLPAIDNDDLRRGRPTCHTRFGEATAILAGDALQTHAFLVLAEHTPRRAAVPALVLELARAAGTGGMVGGEVADIEAEGRPPDAATVEFIHERKTAALFVASVAMGGLAAGADETTLDALRRFGSALGVAFQIVDDVLDETGDAQQLGKSPGKDRAARKMSYPAAVGLDASRRRAQECRSLGLKALASVPENETLAGLLEFTVTRVN